MLTSDLVPVRRKDGELRLSAITGKVLRQHLELAEQVVVVAGNALGNSREQLMAELHAVAQSATETRIVRGFAKLIEDCTSFEHDRGRGAAERREKLFEWAARVWQSLGDEQRFERAPVIDTVAADCGVEPAEFEAELFVDLPGAQRVVQAVEWTPEELVRRYEDARVAAILLRAVSVRVTFRVQSALVIRDLFRVLKFRQLMFELEHLPDGRHQLTMTGPYSLFESVTKYGLQLALCWPFIRCLDGVSLEADLKWGKRNERLRFVVDSSKVAQAGAAVQGPSSSISGTPEETSSLIAALQAQAPNAVVRDADRVLTMPGIGLCVPDIKFEEDGECVYLELMGYWSRQSVWRRVELVEAGMVEPVLFLASSRLRVSEEVLDDQAISALYVYRGSISPKRVLTRIRELLERRRSKGVKRRLQRRDLET